MFLPDASSTDIRRSEELSLLKPPDDPSRKKKKKEKEHEHDDLWDIDLLSMGPGSAGTLLLIEHTIKHLPTRRQFSKYFLKKNVIMSLDETFQQSETSKPLEFAACDL